LTLKNIEHTDTSTGTEFSPHNAFLSTLFSKRHKVDGARHILYEISGLSAYPRSRAMGHQKDMSESIARLNRGDQQHLEMAALDDIHGMRNYTEVVQLDKKTKVYMAKTNKVKID
jgi:hypothetical protein